MSLPYLLWGATITARLDSMRSPDRVLRVGFFDHTAELSGGELALSRLLPAIPGIEAVVILGEEGPFAELLRRRAITVVILSMGALGNVRKDDISGLRATVSGVQASLRYVGALAKLFHDLNLDIVHCNSLKAGYLGSVAARLSRVPVVWHLRDRLSPDYLPKLAVALTRWAVLVLPDAVICNSETTAKTARPKRGTAVIPSPVVPDSRISTRDPGRRHHNPESGLTVGLVGRLAPWKGQQLFIEAFAAAFPAPAQDRAVLIGAAMFGEEDYEASLVTLIGRLALDSRVVLRGFQSDVSAELAQLDLLVHASTIPEPFGQVVIEGMAAGVPVIAADTGGPAEIIHDGIDGLLYRTGSVEALTEALTLAAGNRDLCERVAAEGLQRVQDFTPEKAGRAVRGVYDAISKV